MTHNEMKDLGHGEKIKGPDGTIYIVHNNHRSGEGMIVAVRSMIIPYNECNLWKKVGSFDCVIEPGTYQVTIDKKIY